MSNTTGSKLRVALLGLGNMGAGMAGRLLSAGFPTTLYNRDRAKADALAQRGAVVASSPREAATNAGVVISMVADDSASRQVWLGENGALAAAPRGAVLIECSTLSVDWVRELGTAATPRGCELLDAPVTGSKPQAAAGELLFLVGGSAVALERARPVLAILGRDAIHLGPAGSGAALKLINNFLCGVQAASIAEALAWIDAAGLDRAKAVAILGAGAPGSPVTRRIAERALQNDFATAFSLRLMAKDLTYALREASARGVELQTGASALARFEQGMRDGLGEQDFAAVTESVQRAGRRP